ncbi:hypothetical protein H634G_11593 [Metarhizium anisopliae BRIP 53293]|uniref:Uncharacterized protein n=1 Tax=Metarhizium anisopliae BRIP 53293 TaxID=1291518 RepID=A0A0D9NH48_METAN|nr:hypothetical protein H634G_11593 [Metarhizium anisopliae BRIP 53293]
MGLQCFAARPISSSTFATSRYADMLNRTTDLPTVAPPPPEKQGGRRLVPFSRSANQV